jgi:hypothetical protein
MKELKYNYILAGVDRYYSSVYKDLQNKPNIKCYKSYIDGIKSKFIQLIVRATFNIRLNKYIQTPFKHFTYPMILRNNFKDRRSICYIFLENQYAVINTSYIDYLKRKYTNAKFVLYMQDLVSSLPYYNINEYKNKFDLILSYDKGDCEKYKLEFYPTPYSTFDGLQHSTKEKSDVFFCGYAKQRFRTILDVYDKCSNAGLKCLFFIMGVSIENQVKRKGIIYNTPISYEENIAYVKQSRCILEIMQDNATGFTLRLWESITYDKHLLSNNKSIRNSNFYNPDNVHFVQDQDSYDWITKEVIYSDEIKKSLSPLSLIERIDSLL